MKKKIFMVLSAVVVLAMGVFVVACSKDSNALNPNEVISVEEVAPTPTLQKTNSAAEWATFNLEIEKLNAKYLTPEVVGRAMRIGRDSGALSKEEKWQIVIEDLLGAIEGAGYGASLSAGNPWAIAGLAVVVGAARSIQKGLELTDSGCMVSINPLPSNDDLDSDSLANVIGERHNMIIIDIMNDITDIKNMSNSDLLCDLTNRYERLFGPLSNTIKSSLESINIDTSHEISMDLEQATARYAEVIVELNTFEKHNYTEEYLEVIDATLADSEEKTQMEAGIGTGYHSASLWEIEEQQP